MSLVVGAAAKPLFCELAAPPGFTPVGRIYQPDRSIKGEFTMAQPFTLPPLPFAEGALAPVISPQPIGFHYGKHHKTYVEALNKLVSGTEFEGQSLEAIIKATAGKAGKSGVFNTASQAWNHTFYWTSLKANGGGPARGALAQKIDAAFGSYDKFKSEFADTAVKQFVR